MLDGAESSFLDLRDPSHLDFEYHQQMDAVLTALRGEGEPLRALHLGGAGCALARAWDVTRPGSQQVAVEIDEILASQVRTWFDLPRSPRLRIRVGDAAEVVAGLRPGQWDVVVRDVFDGGSVPASCRSREFFDSCLRALAPDGLLLVNTASMPRAVAGAEIAALSGALDGDISRAFIVAIPPRRVAGAGATWCWWPARTPSRKASSRRQSAQCAACRCRCAPGRSMTPRYRALRAAGPARPAGGN